MPRGAHESCAAPGVGATLFAPVANPGVGAYLGVGPPAKPGVGAAIYPGVGATLYPGVGAPVAAGVGALYIARNQNDT